MKDYKVGDTIYVKGKIKQIDEDDDKYPYGVVFNDCDYTDAWISDQVIVEPPAKVELPKDVADEMEAYKEYGDDFNEYIYNVMAVPDTHYLIKTHDAFVRSDVTVETLLNAWNNGYTVEKEKKYNLILGTDGYDCIHAICKRYDKDGVFIDDETYEVSNLQCDQDYQFTQEEIDKYNKNFWIKNLDLNDYKVEVHTDED